MSAEYLAGTTGVERLMLERKLDELYSRYELEKLPDVLIQNEAVWNDGFHHGKLHALEQVCMELFGKYGDELCRKI